MYRVYLDSRWGITRGSASVWHRQSCLVVIEPGNGAAIEFALPPTMRPGPSVNGSGAGPQLSQF